jgi:hypothetical protein
MRVYHPEGAVADFAETMKEDGARQAKACMSSTRLGFFPWGLRQWQKLLHPAKTVQLTELVCRDGQQEK